MSAPGQEQQGRAAVDAALLSLAVTAAELAMVIGLSYALHHQAGLRARARHLAGRLRRRPVVDELAVAEWASEVAVLSHEGISP